MPEREAESFEVKLRETQPSLEETQREYERHVREIGAKLVELVPGTDFEIDEVTTGSCRTEGFRSRAKTAYVTSILRPGIPDEKWPQALSIVRSQAESYGWAPLDMFTYADAKGHHDVALTATDGVEIRFGTELSASLTVSSGCRMSEADKPK
ncbi:LppA family lipoprotein [Gordonia sp. (in: high G+C Gram-positive bacteria)]|uniref:LppA family lipoprotein n=1 Tax=Gordonia sp. (in: high G+C Gram-positive bacteria) TaxID=84139 RepID=UPI0039E45348